MWTPTCLSEPGLHFAPLLQHAWKLAEQGRASSGPERPMQPLPLRRRRLALQRLPSLPGARSSVLQDSPRSDVKAPGCSGARDFLTETADGAYPLLTTGQPFPH